MSANENSNAQQSNDQPTRTPNEELVQLALCVFGVSDMYTLNIFGAEAYAQYIYGARRVGSALRFQRPYS